MGIIAIPIDTIFKGEGKTIQNIECENLNPATHCLYSESKKLHYQFKISDKTDTERQEIEVVINVRSNVEPFSLLCYFTNDLQIPDESNFSLSELKILGYGMKIFNYGENENRKSNISIDFLRSKLFNLNEFESVPVPSERMENEDLNKRLSKYILKIQEKNTDIYSENFIRKIREMFNIQIM
ncbi:MULTISPECIES: DUF2278 family protein [Bacillus cereus group]|uniref:DUF2278 family protein n=1 Tax=Bacillus cereus group TaxID=86661 RepID=UPI000BF75F54|nr:MULTISPECIES: DUF2278 family protein [Bacillus cereus group]MBY0015193.1 DUF2278 family protein [Bacillus cereus]MDA2062676.1 DUF2278 family protein [Bacillus cereus]PES30815.1 hypothetical protein CN493_28685 [Bacillus thuringiensis]